MYPLSSACISSSAILLVELLTILLSALLAVVSSVGIVTDRVLTGAIRSRLQRAEQLQVRVDNRPNYQLVQGKVERVRLAGRGLWLTPEIRIAALDVETDPIHLDLKRLGGADASAPQSSLQRPLQAGLRLVLTESDLERALQSPAGLARLQQLSSRLFGQFAERYEFLNPQVKFLRDDRISVQIEIVEAEAPPLVVTLESGLKFVAGHSLELIEPEVRVDGTALPASLVTGLTRDIGQRLDLRTLEAVGVTARLLKFEVRESELEVAAFVRVSPSD
jgi:hypothetical protein